MRIFGNNNSQFSRTLFSSAFYSAGEINTRLTVAVFSFASQVLCETVSIHASVIDRTKTLTYIKHKSINKRNP